MQKHSMYCDENFNIMLAGKKLLNREAASKLPFKWKLNNKTATAKQIRAEWDLVWGVTVNFPGFYDATKYAQLYMLDKHVDMIDVVNYNQSIMEIHD